MNATEIIREIEALPEPERARIAVWLTERQRVERRARLAGLAGCWTQEQADTIERLIEGSFEAIATNVSPLSFSAI